MLEKGTTLTNFYIILPLDILDTIGHCVKSVQIRSFFWSVFSRIRTEYREIRSISPYSAQMWENKDHKKSVFGHFSRNGKWYYCQWLRNYKSHKEKDVQSCIITNHFICDYNGPSKCIKNVSVDLSDTKTLILNEIVNLFLQN